MTFHWKKFVEYYTLYKGKEYKKPSQYWRRNVIALNSLPQFVNLRDRHLFKVRQICDSGDGWIENSYSLNKFSLLRPWKAKTMTKNPAYLRPWILTCEQNILDSVRKSCNLLLYVRKTHSDWFQKQCCQIGKYNFLQNSHYFWHFFLIFWYFW